MSWTLERDCEQIIKNMIVAAVDTNAISVIASLLDDDDSCDREEREFPRITIAADPAAKPTHRGLIHEVPITVSVETYMGTGPDDDPKRTNLVTFYGQTRECLDTCTISDPTGYKTIALTFEQGGSNEMEGAINRMIIPLVMRVNRES